ncbi:roadblock/LC7 domain-containing protein [Actinomadura sp. CNU-125]|uniref:roadblock/LC7 domain-containing protein n=1 Tax=Actinomadura sp. CNU-125 TaxID=1904961 RepID=UPI0021CC7D14|nr:roadblock/LC7 domain-containing protein [Actinomadura sp. CNU-125]
MVALVDDFVDEAPGVSHALIVSADGLVLTASRGLPRDLTDSLSAMVAGLIGLCRNIATHIDRGSCEHVMLRLTHGHLLFMGIGPQASLAVLTEAGTNVGTVAQQMNELVGRSGQVLSARPQVDLHQHSGERPS